MVFFSDESLAEFVKVIDAVNIDLKSFSNDFYKKYCKGRLDPVLRSIEFFHKHGVWVEVTTLIIPGLNDSNVELKKIAEFIASISKDIPWHISRFHPTYKLFDKKITPINKLLDAKKIGLDVGLSFVYIGNVSEDNVTICPICKKELIVRSSSKVVSNLKNDSCSCGYELKGVFNE